MEFISDGCLELTGYEPDDLINNHRLAFDDLIHPEDLEFVWTHIQAHLARREVYQVAYRITDAHGRLRWVWEQGRGVFASQGELLAIEGFITDMSERRGAEEQAKRRLWFEARTGLTPRAIFDSLLAWSQQQAQAGGTPCALLVIDLLGLDERAAQQGHDWAERALTVLARRLGPVLGPGAHATHLGRHRFAALVHDLRGHGHEPGAWDARHLILPASRLAAAVAERLRGALPGEAGAGPECAIGIAITAGRYGSGEAVMLAAQRAAVQAAGLEGERVEFADE
jgi:PAS domain S-box-containing protein